MIPESKIWYLVWCHFQLDIILNLKVLSQTVWWVDLQCSNCGWISTSISGSGDSSLGKLCTCLTRGSNAVQTSRSNRSMARRMPTATQSFQGTTLRWNHKIGSDGDYRYFLPSTYLFGVPFGFGGQAVYSPYFTEHGSKGQGEAQRQQPGGGSASYRQADETAVIKAHGNDGGQR